MYSKLGYAVVAFDNRGSAGRSLYFQGQIKGQLGEVEVSDQIAGIDFVSREFGVIDKKTAGLCGANPVKFHPGAVRAWEEAGHSVPECAKP